MCAGRSEQRPYKSLGGGSMNAGMFVLEKQAARCNDRGSVSRGTEFGSVWRQFADDELLQDIAGGGGAGIY
jgi:hypothetical protein